MDDIDCLGELVSRLYQIRREAGPNVFRAATHGALVAIARAVLIDAEDRTTQASRTRGRIIAFPLPRRD